MINKMCILVLLTLCSTCNIKDEHNYQLKNLENINLIINSKKEGKHIIADGYGSVISILSYKDDVLHGECIRYYSNGNIRSKVHYKLGKENGMAYYFYESGVIQAFREWKEGKKIGYAMDYYDNSGETKAAMIYNEDGCLMKRKTFDEKGNLIKMEGE